MEELQWQELLGWEEGVLGGSGERTRGCEGMAGGAQHLNLGSPGCPRARWAAPWPEGEAFSASGLCVLKSALELLGKLPGMGATVIPVAAFFISPCSGVRGAALWAWACLHPVSRPLRTLPTLIHLLSLPPGGGAVQFVSVAEYLLRETALACVNH